MAWTGNSNPVPSNLQSEMTSDQYTVGSTSTYLTLVAPSGQVVVTNPTTTLAYVNWRGGTCTSSNFRIQPGGGTATYDGAQIPGFSMLSSSGSLIVDVTAN